MSTSSYRRWSEKNVQTLVLEIGWTKLLCGYAGEAQPRASLRWHLNPNDARKGVVSVQEWKEILQPWLYQVFYTYLLVVPKDKHVVICEDLLMARNFRNALAALLFHTYQVGSISVLFGMAVTIYATGRTTCLVIDAGWKDTRVLPIYHARMMLQAYQVVSSGSATICEELADILCQRPENKESLHHIQNTDFLENALVQALFVQSLHNPLENVETLRIPTQATNTLEISGSDRGNLAESLFRGEQSIAYAALDALRKSPVDARAALLRNMIVIGGTSLLPGFHTRLQEEMVAIVEQEEPYTSLKQVISCHGIGVPRLHFPANILAWVGASIRATLPESEKQRILVEQFDQAHQQLPDWMDVGL